MKERSAHIAAALLLVAALAAGCISTERAYPAKRQYVLDASREGEKLAKPLAGAVKVRQFSISSRFDGREFVYRIGDVAYESDFYNEFLASPASMLTEEIRLWLAGSGIFANAVDAGSGAAAVYVLEGNVPRLCGDYADRASPQAVLEIQFFLIDDRAGAGAVAFQKTYTAGAPMASRDPGDLVRGWNACLAEILTGLENDLRAALR